MKRVIKFKESKVYKFLLDYELEKGELEVSILDSSKKPVMVLDKCRRGSTIEVDKRKRYYLVFKFKSASGNYELKWS